MLIDGYKRHVLHDLDTGLIRAVGITPANVPEASVTEAISEDLKLQKVQVKELHIDRAYLSSHLVRERDDDLEVYVPRLAGSREQAFFQASLYLRLGTTDHPLSKCAGNALCPRRSGPLP